MIEPSHALPVVRQCTLPDLFRSSVYYTPQPVSASDLAWMRRIDELPLNHPFAGARMLRDLLALQGVSVGRRHVATRMKKRGIEALYRRPDSSRQHPPNPVFRYLPRGLDISRANHVRALDITYLPMRKGFLYLAAVLDWATPRVLSWRLSNTFDYGLLPGSRRGCLAPLRHPGDLQPRPRQSIHPLRLRQPDSKPRHPGQHGWQGPPGR